MDLPNFERRFFRADNQVTRIGRGELGGKAHGLLRVLDAIRSFPEFPGITVGIPRMVVITTELFDAFMEEGDLWPLVLEQEPDDARIANAFHRAPLPARFAGDLRALAEEADRPLAVRSSSLLEDAMYRPFAGVYGTKMVPNGDPSPDVRFRRLNEAIKFVLASTFFAEARRYQTLVGAEPGDEKMAVIVQEVVGQRHRERFYPTLSGVARSWNFYPTGRAKSVDGVVQFALGLGKTIVDGGNAWSFSPAFPRTPPPLNDLSDLLKNTQTRFWSVHMGRAAEADPLRETEHLRKDDLSEAEYDGSLRFLASTVDPRSGRRVPGIATQGARVLDFAPILVLGQVPLNDVIREVLRSCQATWGAEVELEFAVELDPAQGLPARFGLVQVRPMVVSTEPVDVPETSPEGQGVVIRCQAALGNGIRDDIRDVVYVDPKAFDPAQSPAIALEVASLDARLSGTPYLLVGPGRWGTSDPWYGIPVTWSQISGARVIVEATMGGVEADPSQGSHFFHNVTSFQVLYLTASRRDAVSWDWLDHLEEVTRTKHVVHARARMPLEVRVDGRTGHGVVLCCKEEDEDDDVELPDAASVEPTAADLILDLRERAKELACLYRVEEALREPDRPLSEVFGEVIEALPPGWRFPSTCQARVLFGGRSWATSAWRETPWTQRAEIRVAGEPVGAVEVCYLEEQPWGPSVFLAEEERLVSTIAERLGHYVLHQRLTAAFESRPISAEEARPDWKVALELLRMTHADLYARIARKMSVCLFRLDVEGARGLLERYGASSYEEENTPSPRALPDNLDDLYSATFALAEEHLSEEQVHTRVREWANEDRALALVRPLQNDRATMSEVTEAIRRYRGRPRGVNLPKAARAGIRVNLIRRTITENLDYISVAKKWIDIEDFHDLSHHIISPDGSPGRLGGKSAGLFLASRVLAQSAARVPDLGQVRTPRTWYISSDGLLAFIRANDLDEVIEQKYKSAAEVRQEYPQLVQLFKTCRFPRALLNGLSLALDDFGDVPLIVRSSSLLEDQLGAAFSGKYKSLFVANSGTRQERLDALCDAIAEVYASTFGPDPVEYRSERGLLDFHEEMGVMIQEVVGRRVGRYFLPAFAGVAFGRNELRWSPRIRRTDGLVRLVPGLGTRAVDRVGDDYPVLLAPGQPTLRVNASVDETIRYAPAHVDVMDLEDGVFRTLSMDQLLREVGGDYPGLARVVSVLKHGLLQPPNPLLTDFERDTVAVTFEGLARGTPFLRQMAAILRTLESALGYPVDLEFASTGDDLVLLQCRPQSHAQEAVAAQLPRNIPQQDLVFRSTRHVSNGRIPDLTHLVYVDPEAYGSLPTPQAMAEVGRCVGDLNSALPRRRFILVGPGRWGSRGDVKLGVRVGYSDIHNTAALVEVARRKGSYVPDLSFGTHFFQDLVEASIRYLPLYPDEPGQHLAEDLIREAPNALGEILPQWGHLQEVVRVVDIPALAHGRVLRVLANAEAGEALAFLADPSEAVRDAGEAAPVLQEDHWRWRHRLAERLAASVRPGQHGIQALYLFGSVKDGTSGPASDIDLLVHFRGTPTQRQALDSWLRGWSQCLAELNRERTGFECEGLLDVHVITDEDIERRTSFALKIGAHTDGARELPLASD